MAEIRDVDSNGQIVVESTPKELVSEKNITAPVVPELQIKAVEEVMGLETDSEKKQYTDKVKTLLDYVNASSKGLDLEGIKNIIRDLELEIGSPPLSERRINYVARYAFLKMGSIEAKNKSIELAKQAERLRSHE
jgi:hypothetical protein